MNQRAKLVMRHVALMCQMLRIAVTFSYANKPPLLTKPNTPSTSQEERADLKLKVTDGATKKAIRNTAIEIYGENTIVCCKAPCPGNGIKWSGKTDGHGLVTVPGTVLTWSEVERRSIGRYSVTITAAGYGQRRLYYAQESKRKGERRWIIALDADRRPQRESQ